MKLRLIQSGKNWILYDVGNSAFVLLSATLLPIYFNSIAADAGLNDAQYLAFWGYAASAATLAVALLGPALGALADTKGYKKPFPPDDSGGGLRLCGAWLWPANGWYFCHLCDCQGWFSASCFLRLKFV